MAQVDELIAQLAAEDGYRVASRDDRVVLLERKNSWWGVAITALLSGIGGGVAMQRTDRVYLVVDEAGNATMQLAPPTHG